MRDTIRVMSFCLLLIVVPGCMTRGLWEQASATTMHPQSFQGFVAGDNGQSTEGLLIGYKPDSANYYDFSTEVSVFVPTDADALPLEPYRCDGMTPSASQIRAVETIVFKDSDYALGKHLRNSSNFRALHPDDGKRWFNQSLETSSQWGAVSLMTIVKIPALPSDRYAGRISKETYVAVLLPSSAPRSEADIRVDQVCAAFLTPVTMVGDVASVPLSLGGWFLWVFVAGDK
jgi:hypothetical protein